MVVGTTILILLLIGILLYYSAAIEVWAMTYTLLSIFYVMFVGPHPIIQILLFIGLIGFGLFCFKPLRIFFISRHLIRIAAKKVPPMSETERIALEAGTVGFEAELFSGDPDFEKLQDYRFKGFTEEEQAFLDGPVNQLCRMIDDWDITHNRTDLPTEVWCFIKEQGFLGMIIPRSYGGLGFSATAQIAVLMRLYGLSVGVATTVSVPNSLGPAELLLKYGTTAQKNYYLPLLAKGIEIPCFALTGPYAGSDAASIPDKGEVMRRMVDGVEVVGIELNWNKRYITLCPVATIIGLAFRLFDPENILGKGTDVGITCALIPANLPGVTKGRRHFPMNTAFLNGPTQGKKVFITLDCLIGGAEMVGQGWLMLMECLSAGRALSLPSSAVGGAQAGVLGSSAYARIRQQFNTAIGRFEGVGEKLATIAGNTYLTHAGLMMTAATIDKGAKPAVAGAILKYHTTERARQIAIDAMDIHGGKGICLGPNNYLGRAYQAAPISITVEGANILTRNLIIFGQGAVRCHPFVYSELKSIRTLDVRLFDKAIFGHIGFALSNMTRSFIFSLSDARLLRFKNSSTQQYYQLIKRYSAHLAFLTDLCLLTLGGSLKRKESISARLGDVLSNLYLATSVLYQYEDDGMPVSDLSLVDWSCQTLFYECEQAIQQIIDNFPVRWARIIMRTIVFPFGHYRKKPTDKLTQSIAESLLSPNISRDRLTRWIFKEPVATCPLGRLEVAFNRICSAELIEKKLHLAMKSGTLVSIAILDRIDEAATKGVLTEEEAETLREVEALRLQVIMVDDFDDKDLRRVEARDLKSQEKFLG